LIISAKLKELWHKAADLIVKRRPPPDGLDFEWAMKFFDKQAARKDMALGYVFDACQARCHLMGRAAIKMGLKPRKVWVIDKEYHKPIGSPTIEFSLPSSKEIRYLFHTALVLDVKSPEGKIHALVFDPLLFDGPVSIKQWGRTMNLHHRHIKITDWGEAPEGYSSSYDLYSDISQVQGAGKELTAARRTARLYRGEEEIPRLVFPSDFCRTVLFPALGQWPKRRGRGWISHEPFPRHPLRPSTTAPGSPSRAPNGPKG
jgi:hypothetical protein